MPQLTDEQLERVRDFFTSDAASILWQRLEAGIMADWVLAETSEAREKCWHELQAVLQLQATLRDAPAMKHIDGRSQAARTAPGYGTRSQT